MKLGRIYGVSLRQYYLLRGSMTRIIPLFLWGAIDMILWGFITKYLNHVSSAMNFVPVLLGAILLWDFLVRVMHGYGIAFLEDVWSRNFLNIFASPLAISEYLSGLLITSMITSAMGLMIMLLIACGVFGLSFAEYGFAFFAFLMVLFMFGIALGIFACALVLRYGPPAEWFMWPIPALISPFAAVFYPISMLPEWMQTISLVLPPAYVFESLRSILDGKGFSNITLLTGVGLSFLYIMLACWFFSIIHKRALRTGLIARYSAESIS